MKHPWRWLFSLLLPFVTAALVPFDDWGSQRVALKDANIFFRYAGNGPPVMLVHGYPQHSVSYRALNISG